MTKITKKDNFTALLAIPAVAENPVLVEFIQHEIELLTKKAENRSTKPTVRQAENEAIKSDIVAKMEFGRWYRCAEIQAMNETLAAGVGTKRTSRLCNDMASVSDGRLRKKIEKKVVYFALAE